MTSCESSILTFLVGMDKSKVSDGEWGELLTSLKKIVGIRTLKYYRRIATRFEKNVSHFKEVLAFTEGSFVATLICQESLTLATANAAAMHFEGSAMDFTLNAASSSWTDTVCGNLALTNPGAKGQSAGDAATCWSR